ncbi:penicillin-binding protein 1A [Pontibacter ummariensis]|uniref:Penicillin-binding protein 1A n=2 Tax=Pontibacter ummariensis TaxID=1610492 RepID=A0A239KEK6_9BACT|nr:penicillin-binding protein 1A [Pontibacter ummariensis]SNT16420.1 penicillin-binding protein 1A [Pontibacter ummariensis]
MLYVLRPVVLFLWKGGHRIYERHQDKLTAHYWRRQKDRLREFDWRRARLQDFMFLWPGARRVLLFLALCFFVIYLAVYMGLLGGVPSRHALKAIQNNTASEVYAAGGELLGRYYIQDRTNVRYEDISPVAVDALIATEDARFYQHSGVDVRSSSRVLIKSLLLQEESGGGSTLSQQLAKNLYPRRDYGLFSTPMNKLREIVTAHKLEGIYSKKELLELYLNTVPMGGNIYGIERSARRFFNTSADSLKAEEAAVLIGMLKATTTYNPRLHPEAALRRRNVVLSQMAKYNYLSPAEADSLKGLPLALDYNYTTHHDGLAPYFREQLRQELAAWCSKQEKENGEPYNLYTDGLKIYTTIDAGMQVHAERAVCRKMAQLQERFDKHWKGRAPWGKDEAVVQHAMQRSDRYRKMQQAGLPEEAILEAFKKPVSMSVFSWGGSTKKEMSPLDSLRHYARLLNTGLLAMEPQTGYVRAWVGGINHEAFKYDHVLSRRQVGSTFKPFVYAAALEKGIPPCTYFPNERRTYTDYQDWSPQNATGQYGGEYSMRGALAHSVNTISAQLIMETGVDRTVDMAHRLGIQSELPEVPSLALGTANLSLLEMVSAYASFANGGYRVPPVYVVKITDRKGKVLRQHGIHQQREKVLSRTNAAIMLQLLQGVVEEGSAARLRAEYGLKMDIAGKTGTTQEHADGWFIGITPKLVTGVWVGAESPKVGFRSLELGQGSRTALPVWGDFMRRIAIDPAFPGYFYSRFDPLPPGVEARLACDSYRPPAPAPEEKEGSFLDRLFDRVFGKEKKTEKKKNRGRWRW